MDERCRRIQSFVYCGWVLTMKYRYSAATNAFYPWTLKDDYLKEDAWPESGVDVDEDIFEEYCGAPPEGKIRSFDKKGNPCWIDIPPPTTAELIAQAEAKRSELLFSAKEHISLWQTELQLGIISDDDKASLITWMTYIQALNAVDTSTAPDIEWPVKPE